jgi:non-specific serine/threonine protein kinase
MPIGSRAFWILEILAQSAGGLVAKDELMSCIWPGEAIPENTLPVHVAAARRVLGRYRELLETDSGRGYRLLGQWTSRRHRPGRAADRSQIFERHAITHNEFASDPPAAVAHAVGL